MCRDGTPAPQVYLIYNILDAMSNFLDIFKGIRYIYGIFLDIFSVFGDTWDRIGLGL